MSNNQINLQYSIFEKSLENKDFSNLFLIVEVLPRGITFAVLDNASNTFMLLQHYNINTLDTLTLSDAMSIIRSQQNLFNKKFAKNIVLCGAISAVLIPETYFEERNASHYVSPDVGTTGDTMVLWDKLNNLKAFNVFAVSQSMYKSIVQSFDNPVIRANNSGLIENLLFQTKDKTQKIYIHFQSGNMDIVFIKSKELLFYNRFQIKSPEDFIYYILSVYKELQLIPTKHELQIIGEIEKDSSYIQLLAKYIRNIEYGTKNDLFRFSTAFDELPKHFHYNILNLHV